MTIRIPSFSAYQRALASRSATDTAKNAPVTDTGGDGTLSPGCAAEPSRITTHVAADAIVIANSLVSS